MSDIVGSIPEFTVDESTETGVEEVKQPVVDETSAEKETPELPAEQPQTEQPAPTKVEGEDTEQPEVSPEVLQKAVERATSGLRNEIVDLRNKLAVATGNDRKIIQQSIVTAEQKLDELADVNPEDQALIEKVLKAKGYVSKDELSKITYEQAQKQTLNQFLDKYPEYKPENDPNDVNWKALQKELSIYRMPDDPTKIIEILERSHRAIKPQVVSTVNIPAKKRSLQVASAGAGGVQRSSSSKTLNPEMRRQYEDGGWTKEEIDQIEKNLQ